ncbi:MAG: fumarylacetoacetate hydrolase family protein [Pseudomonadales bacterium]
MNTVVFDGQEIVPSKVVCIGRNYVEHITELGNEMPTEPVIFVKPNSAIGRQLFSRSDGQFHFESELSFIVEQNTLAGVGFGLDLTKRDMQSTLKAKGLPWERAKAFDNSAVFSKFVRCDVDLASLKLELRMNDSLVQQGGCELMIYKPQTIVAEIIGFMTLEDGDIVMTGTPKGVGTFSENDEFTGRIYANDKLLLEQNWTAIRASSGQ